MTDSTGDIGITDRGRGPPDNPVGGIGPVSGFVAGQARHFQVFSREFVAQGRQAGQSTTNAVSETF